MELFFKKLDYYVFKWYGSINGGDLQRSIMPNPSCTFGERLLKLRHEARISPYLLADKLGIEYSTYHNYEMGTIPPFERMVEIIKILGFSFGYFFLPFSSSDDPEYIELCEKIKKIRRHDKEWDSIKTIIEGLYLSLTAKEKGEKRG